MSRCMMKAQLYWANSPESPGNVVRLDSRECFITRSITYAHQMCSGSKRVLSGPVDRGAMIAAFITDLQSTRDAAQYHRAFSNLRTDICDNTSLRFDQKIDKLIRFNRGFCLPIPMAVLNEAEDGINEIVFGYDGHILAENLNEYAFFNDLRDIAAKPYLLEPMDESSDEYGVDGTDGNVYSEDSDSLVGDSEEEEMSFGDVGVDSL